MKVPCVGVGAQEGLNDTQFCREACLESEDVQVQAFCDSESNRCALCKLPNTFNCSIATDLTIDAICEQQFRALSLIAVPCRTSAKDVSAANCSFRKLVLISLMSAFTRRCNCKCTTARRRRRPARARVRPGAARRAPRPRRAPSSASAASASCGRRRAVSASSTIEKPLCCEIHLIWFASTSFASFRLRRGRADGHQ